MHLLNFSIGKVRTETMFGEPVPSAMVKQPIPQPWSIGEDGPIGNERALHVDALFVYGRNQYDYWARELSVEGAWPDGFFGENLTLDNVVEGDLHVGDVYEIGDQVRIVVAGPRTPCWKVAWRLDQPMTILRTMALSGHTGTYFRVQAPGVVRPGDELRLIESHPESPTVAEIAQLCSSDTLPTEQEVVEALANASLSDMTRLVLHARLSASQRASGRSEHAWPGWRSFDIVDSRALTSDTWSYTLRPDDGRPLPTQRPGQYVSIRFPSADIPTVRAWTLSKHAETPEDYEISVKHLTDGQGSGLLQRTFHQRGKVELRSPTGNFTLDEGTFKPIVLIAGGIGITPLRAMIQAHLRRGEGTPPLWILYGGRSSERQAFRDEIDEIGHRHDDVHVLHFLTDPSKADRVRDAFHENGRITPEAVASIMRDNYIGPIRLPWYEAMFYVCGPDSFGNDLRQGLIDLGASSDHVHVEAFSSDLADESGAAVVPHAHVNFQRSRITAEWIAGDHSSLLDVAEEHGLNVPTDCRSGICNSCRTEILFGDVTHTADSGSALLCQSRPLSAEISIDL